MDEALFRKIVGELAEVRFQGGVCFANYNEPLADDAFDDWIRTAYELNPKGNYWFNTNGDYINRKWMDKLYAAGLRKFAISVYVDVERPLSFTYEKGLLAVNNMASKLALDVVIRTIDNSIVCAGNCYYYPDGTGNDPMYILLRAENHCLMANYRAGIISSEQPISRPNAYGRRRMCLYPYATITINFNGKVTPCSSIRPDYEKHGEFIMGDLRECTIWDLFAGENFQKYRLRLIRDMNSYPCEGCADYTDNWKF
jgi:MoaA/NifB/PqqE/SkfB family radical SAM enzyme